MCACAKVYAFCMSATRQVNDPLFKDLDTIPASHKETWLQSTTIGQDQAAGQNDLKTKTTKSNSSSFVEFIDTDEEDSADVVEKPNNEHSSIISSLTSLNRCSPDSKVEHLQIKHKIDDF